MPKGTWVKQPVRDDRIFAFEVYLNSGPMTDEYIEANPHVSRTIEIRGDQSLDLLHGAIFKAYDREEEHLYAFEVGDGPQDPNLRRFGPLPALDPDAGDDFEDSVRTAVGTLPLVEGCNSGYLFDFGDEWWHSVAFLGIREAEPGARYPRIVGRVGESPPQYADFEDDDEDEEWDEDDE